MKASITPIAEELWRHSIGDSVSGKIVDVPIRHKQVRPAVEVRIQKLRPESQHQVARILASIAGVLPAVAGALPAVDETPAVCVLADADRPLRIRLAIT